MTDDLARAWHDFELSQRALAAAADRIRRLTDADASAETPRLARTFEVETALRAACIERNFVLTGDGSVGEADAAALLGFSGPTLVGWRATGTRIPWRKLSGRIQYKLADLAAFICSAEETDF